MFPTLLRTTVSCCFPAYSLFFSVFSGGLVLSSLTNSFHMQLDKITMNISSSGKNILVIYLLLLTMAYVVNYMTS